jgi:putative ABC transport system permease protein
VRFSLWKGGTLEQVRVFYRSLEERLAAVPGVESVGSVFGAPLGSYHTTARVQVEGRPDPLPGTETLAGMRAASPRYLQTLCIPLRRGRTLDAADDVAALPVAVVNEEFVRENFAGADPIGRRVRILTDQGYGSPTWTIVGVVGNIRSESLTQPPIAEIYVPHGKFGPGALTVSVRSSREVGGLLSAIRAEVRTLDRVIALEQVETVAQAVRQETRPVRFLMLAGGLFGAVAVTLAAIGLYGALAFLVARRTREIGVRLALGARPAQVTRLVLREGASIVVAGAVVGSLVSLWSGRFLSAMLFRVTPDDPWTATLALGLLLVVVSAAMLLPARRAARVDPATALRGE